MLYCNEIYVHFDIIRYTVHFNYQLFVFEHQSEEVK